MKHVRYFFTRKYLLLLLPVIIGIIVSGYMMATDGKGYFDGEQAISNFVPETQEYSDMSELKTLLEKARDKLKGLDEDDKSFETAKSGVIWYEYLYENEIGYDEIASYKGAKKFSKFSLFDNFSEPVFIFVYLASIILGTLLITWDFQADTAKLLYSSGESKLKILYIRYGISLATLAIATIVIMTVYALVANGLGGVSEIGLIYGDRIYRLSFAGYAALSILSTVVNLCLVYTAIYFASASFHNVVIPLCGAFLGFILLVSVRDAVPSESAIQAFFEPTIFGIFKGAYMNGDNPPSFYFLTYLINVIVTAAIAAIGTTLFYKRDIK